MKPIQVLLIEDSVLDAGLTLAALRRGGFEIEADRVDNGQDLIAALDRKRYKVILADFALPQFDGLSALAIAHERSPETPFIFVSGAIGEETAIESLKNGATDYVLKQRLERLPSAVSRALNESAERERRRRAERNLRRVENHYRALVESVLGFAILAQDTGGVITTWNPGAAKILGYSEQEAVNQHVTMIFTPEDREAGAPEAEMRQAAATGRAEDERWHVRKDGSRFWASGVMSCIRNEDGSLQGFVKVLRDVTDRREAEEKLRRSNEELEQFAYAASHDMQEPLRTVNSYAQMLQRRYGGVLGSDADEFLGFIQAGVRHMQLLLQDLLAYSQLLHESPVHWQAVPLEDVLRKVLLTLDASIQETGAGITHDPLPVVNGDESQLAQVFQNLLSNALKYQKPGNRPVIHVSASEHPGGLREIRVRDNGIGFERDYAERIFGLFRRLHREQYPGTGIGLALSKRIVERHGGTIWADSEPGEGSTFHFTLAAK